MLVPADSIAVQLYAALRQRGIQVGQDLSILSFNHEKPLVVGLSTSPNRVVAQVAGSAFRIRASDFMQALRRCPQLVRHLNRFTHAMAMQATQVAACNRAQKLKSDWRDGC